MYFKKALIALCVFSQGLFCVHGINYPSDGDGIGTPFAPIFSGIEDTPTVIYLDGNASSYENWTIISQPVDASNGSTCLLYTSPSPRDRG